MKLPRITKKGFSIAAVAGVLCWAANWYLLPFAFEIPELKELGSDSQQDGYLELVDYPGVSNQRINQLMIEATLAAEDKRFYRHHGIDPLAIGRAMLDSWGAGRMVSGASTISQQSIKLSRNYPPRNLKSKVIEAYAARHLEMRYNKDTILAYYFSKLEYANNTRGPRSAARHYFRREIDELDIHEVALLAGLPQAPTRHNPRRNPAGAMKRRDWVLERMHVAFQYPLTETSSPPPLKLTKR
ncbi:biosynthetic peptidoglycan transglycosylase [Rubritalea marina]|uniref:biosynthetic peptidoglycan transglycosylase n=1 Tax=Rubritalea marina TaxID=361055 RepID=UPI00037C2AED|nr:biosynthetic peptidoglycan transglycosylase [Rubritalea marina]